MNIKVKGGQKLNGTLTPSGSKNSVVALIPATILFDKPLTLQNVPEITDVDRLVRIMTKLGSKIKWNKEACTMEIDNSSLRFDALDKEDLGSMKGTALLWGPMLARFKKVNFADLPGGCTLGARSLGPQFDTFRELGVKVTNGDGSASMDASSATSCVVWLPEMSPTITENVIMLATSLTGVTKIIGAASEPQVQDLCNFLISAGANIAGVGTNVLTIEGGAHLTAKTHTLMSDHYEIATFITMAAITGGSLRVENALPEHFAHINYIFKKFGVNVQYDGNTAILEKDQKIIVEPQDVGFLTVKAQPWPSLPVDLLPIFIPLALKAKTGQVLFHNWMYEAGLFWTSELIKLGASLIICDPHRVIVNGGNKLTSAKLEAPYIIRATVAMLMCAMIADGESIILNADTLHRGHPHFAENLEKLGVKIEETSN